jgi:hypothetical protein
VAFKKLTAKTRKREESSGPRETEGITGLGEKLVDLSAYPD